LRPLSFFRHIANSSRDSGCAIVQLAGGARYRSQFLQKLTVAKTPISKAVMAEIKPKKITLLRYPFCDVDPAKRCKHTAELCTRPYISYEFLRHGMHRLAEFGSITSPVEETVPIARETDPQFWT